MTATVACLETLERRWADALERAPDLQLVEVALRNTRNAAAMVRSLGDLALLDEPLFKLRRMRLDLGEVLDDITRRFEQRAVHKDVALRFVQRGSETPVKEVDTELFERAVANLLGNALKFTPAGKAIELSVQRLLPADASRPGPVLMRVRDEGPASRPSTCRTCSTACTKAARAWRRPPAKKAKAWGWRSSSALQSCTRAA